ncbi:MAG: DUF2304 domain-containing protein [Undibacterium sp.]
MKIYQLVILFISIYMLYEGVEKFLRHQTGQTFMKLAARAIVWGGMAVIVMFPGLSNNLAHLIGIEGNINAVILTGFILVFLMIFKLLTAIERLEQQVTLFTRKDALKEIEPRDE